MSLKELNNNVFIENCCVMPCTGSSRYTAAQLDFKKKKKKHVETFGKISAERRKYIFICIYTVYQLCQNCGPPCFSEEKGKKTHSTPGR